MTTKNRKGKPDWMEEEAEGLADVIRKENTEALHFAIGKYKILHDTFADGIKGKLSTKREMAVFKFARVRTILDMLVAFAMMPAADDVQPSTDQQLEVYR